MTTNKKTILILTGDAGLGHRSAAEAVSKALEINFGDRCETIINNPLNHPDIPDLIRESQSDYDEIVKTIPELYKLGFKISDSTLPVNLMEGGFTLLLLNVLREIISETAPDLIITTYPIYQAPLAALNESDDVRIPFMAVVTDLVTVHHVWFNPDVTLCTVPTDIVQQRALEAGLSTEQVIKIGIPVDPQILKLKDIDAKDLRVEFGWEKNPTTVLVVGSPRIPSLMDIIQTLDYSGHDIQFALVAGGNDALFTKFNQADWRHPASIYNFVDFMPKLMRASDIIICKAGGLIVTESLASGLPLMIVHVLPGQERGNVDYVLSGGAGKLCETPMLALKVLSSWVENDSAKLKEASENAEKLGHASAAYEIAMKAWELLQEFD